MYTPNAPLRVLHVVDRVTGGVPIAVAAYIQNSPAGVEHHVLSPHDAGAPASVWRGVKATHHDLGFGAFERVRRTRSVARAVRPEVTHAHSSFSGAYTRIALGRGTPKVVYTPHGYSFARPNAGALYRFVFRSIEWIFALRTDLLAACSLHEAAISKTLSTLGDRIDVIPNVAFISRPAHRPRARPLVGALRLGMVGRLDPVKDPEFLARTIADVRALSASRVTGMWIGDGTHAREELADQDIEITGWLDQRDLTAAISELDVYIHTSTTEGFPIAVLDAAALDRPILVRPIPAFGGIPAELTVTAESIGALARAAASPTAFAEWSAHNRRLWGEYLIDHTVESQRASLARVWGVVA